MLHDCDVTAQELWLAALSSCEGVHAASNAGVQLDAASDVGVHRSGIA